MLRDVLALLALFAPLSLVSVGGGQTLVAEIHRQVVANHHWMTEGQFVDAFAISRMAPGPGSLLATLIGWHVAGVWGAIAASIGIFTPTALLVYGLARLWARTRGARWQVGIGGRVAAGGGGYDPRLWPGADRGLGGRVVGPRHRPRLDRYFNGNAFEPCVVDGVRRRGVRRLARGVSGMNELLTPVEMGRADLLAIARGMSGWALMQRAGWAVARAARRFGPCRTLVLCGPGNNGGDGYIAARLLDAAGWPVRLAALDPPRPGSDAALAAAEWSGPMAEFTPAEAARAELVIDAVFGAGLSRDVDGRIADTLAAARRILAVDVPSGVDGATGAARGRVARAACTVTFFRRKPGHHLLPGRALCGDIVLADIGLPSSVLDDIRPKTLANDPALWTLPELPASTQKYARGYVSVLGGRDMTGAAQFSAAAARHGGAGMVTIVAPGAASRYAHVPAGLIVNDQPLDELTGGSAADHLGLWPGPGPGGRADRAAEIAGGQAAGGGGCGRARGLCRAPRSVARRLRADPA